MLQNTVTVAISFIVRVFNKLSLIMDKNLEKLADQYEGNLLNYFCGMTPSQSKRFNKMVKDAKKNRRSK